jgi:excisionase family DNA binding protein
MKNKFFIKINMKNKVMQSEYLSTKDTAQLLGLSVGTVQKLVDKNVLDAFLTSGGHRRIFSESVRKYLARINEKNSSTLDRSNKEKICLILNGQNPEFKLFKTTDALVIKQPIDLILFNENIKNIIIDGEIDWLDFNNARKFKYFCEMNFAMIFNSQHLAQEVTEKLKSDFDLESKSVSTDTLIGLIFGLKLKKFNQ